MTLGPDGGVARWEMPTSGKRTRRFWGQSVAVLLLVVGCGVPNPLDGDALDWFGHRCDPAELTACGQLRLAHGGWCEPVTPTYAECVLPCGATCAEAGGICSTEGVCYARAA